MKTQVFYNKFRVFFFNCVLVFLSYGIMLTHRYSIDGYAVYYEYLADNVGTVHLALGEPINWLVMNVLHLLGINAVTGQKYFTILFMLTMALCITILYFIFCAIISRDSASSDSTFSKQTSLSRSLLLDLAISLAFINVFVCELFVFSEASIYWTGMLFFSILAVWSFFLDKKPWKYVLTALLLTLALNFYQASLGFFLMFTAAGIVISNSLHFNWKTVKETLIMLFIGGFASGVSVACFSVLKWLGITGENSRDPSLSISGIIDNARYLLSLQKEVLLNGLSFIHLWILVFLLALLGVLIYLLVKKHYSASSVLLVFLAVFGCYTCVFAPHLLSKVIYPAVRTLCSFFSIFSVLSILIIYISDPVSSKGRLIELLLCCVSVFLLINTSKIQQVGAEQLAVNVADRIEAAQILNEITDYERETGNTVDTIAWADDSESTHTYPGITNTYLDFGRRADIASWAVVRHIDYYSGRHFRSVEMTDEEYSSHFPEAENWYAFDPGEQIVFVDNTMYWALY